MSRDLEPGESVIARRLGPAAAEEWARVLRHFDLGEGFAFLVLLVPGVEIAELCIRDLESVLRDEGLEVLRFAPETPAELRELAPELVNLEPSPNVGAVWLEAVAPRQVPGAEDWIHAWIELTARLNERRDVLRRHLKVPLLFIGAPWLKEVLREQAPDLWSVRKLVAELEPAGGDDLKREMLPHLRSFRRWC